MSNFNRLKWIKLSGLLLLTSSFFIASTARAADTCSAGMIDGSTHFKATSLGGITISNVVTTWVSGGYYTVSMNIVANQGLKKWYSSTTLNDWVLYPTRSDAGVGKSITDCTSGLVVAAQKVMNNVPISSGTGTVTLSQGSMGGSKGTSFVLYDERVDGFTNISKIDVYSPYAVGVSKEDDAISRNVRFQVIFSDFKNVPDGNYTVNVSIPIGATSTWFPNGNGYNYWWATNGKDIPLNYYITIPVVIRSENQQPVNPTGSCSLPSSVILDHHTMSPGQVNGAYATSTMTVYCNTAMSGSFEITGSDNSSTSEARIDMGKGVTSSISASIDGGTNWYRKLSSVPLKNGNTQFKLRSFLSTSGIPTAGDISGSAVMTVKYN